MQCIILQRFLLYFSIESDKILHDHTSIKHSRTRRETAGRFVPVSLLKNSHLDIICFSLYTIELDQVLHYVLGP